MASLTKNPSIGSQHGTDLEESSRLIYELGFGFLDEDLIGRQSINSNSQGPKAIPVIITDAEAADDEASPGLISWNFFVIAPWLFRGFCKYALFVYVVYGI